MKTPIFICELGINHHGDFDKAKRMASKALECGASYIKFQYYNPDRVLGRSHPALQYAKQCQFTRKQHEELRQYVGPKYLVSVFDVGDIGWANSLCSAHKIASRMNENQEFISKVEQCKKPTFMSVQPTTRTRIPERFRLMWCVRNYPSTKEEVMSYPYGDIGLSSHCPDPSATLEAMRLGARVVENHVCESREEEGCDIASSLTFKEYENLVSLSKAVEAV